MLTICIVVLYPLMCLLIQVILPHSFSVHRSWVPSLSSFGDAFSNRLNVLAVLNSFGVGFAASVVATSFGLLSAYGAHIASPRHRSLINVLTWLVFFAPSYVIAQGWLVFMRDGGVMSQLFHLPNGWSAWFFTRFGLLVAMGFRYFPYVHFAVSQALAMKGETLELAARLSGANRWWVRSRITLPLLYPALLAGASISFAEGFGDFGFSAAITPQTHIPLLTYQIYTLLSQTPIDYGAAATLSLILLVGTAGLLILQFRFMRGKSFSTGSWRPKGTSTVQNKRALNTSTVGALTLVALAFGIPIGSTMCVSLWRTWSNGIALGNWTLSNFPHAFEAGSGAWPSLVRTLVYAGIAAVSTAVIALFTGFQLTFRKSTISRAINVITISTIAVPGVVLAAGFIFAWNAFWLIPIHLVLYGTSACLAMAYVAINLPYAIRLQMSAMEQLPANIITAARVSGSGMFRTLGLIVAPLVVGTTVSTFFMALTSTLFELPASTLLYPAGYPPFPVTIETQFNYFAWSTGSALSVVGMAVLLSLYGGGQWLIQWLQRRQHTVPAEESPLVSLRNASEPSM